MGVDVQRTPRGDALLGIEDSVVGKNEVDGAFEGDALVKGDVTVYHVPRFFVVGTKRRVTALHDRRRRAGLVFEHFCRCVVLTVRYVVYRLCPRRHGGEQHHEERQGAD